MERESSFLGVGWAFPPAFDKSLGAVELAYDVDDIHQSLQILLSTSIGERVMQPTFGCNLRDYQFEPLSNTFLGFLEDMVERAILFFEPRIVVENISITEPEDFQLYEGKVLITVEYMIAGTNTRNNFVYDFYLREADRTI
jgi:hypothetical protein